MVGSFECGDKEKKGNLALENGDKYGTAKAGRKKITKQKHTLEVFISHSSGGTQFATSPPQIFWYHSYTPLPKLSAGSSFQVREITEFKRMNHIK